MLTALADAAVSTCGAKATGLAVLLRAGFAVPDGFVVPVAVHRSLRNDPKAMAALRDAIAGRLHRMGNPPVAVRSSAADEDTAAASGAGQYDSVLAVRGTDEVAAAVRRCWASAESAGVARYRDRFTGCRDRIEAGGPAAGPGMAVLVQRLVDAEVSGVMFTPSQAGEPTRIEASWGLGPAVVGGIVTPDSYQIASDGTLRRTIGSKATRVDRHRCGSGVSARPVPERRRSLPCLDDATVVALTDLGRRIAAALGGAQDVEWAIAGGRIRVLQARPVTASVPAAPEAIPEPDGDAVLCGTPGARGVVTGRARVVRGPAEFERVLAGEILVCPHTDPAWTPLFGVVAGVVTETGGALAHAAIVAREYGIPAVLGVEGATTRIPDGAPLTIDGAAGTVMVERPGQEQ